MVHYFEMKTELIQYSVESGWSTKSFPQLDSARTLVMLFGAQKFLNHPEIFGELFDAFPNSHFIGCSTAGEILNDRVMDDTLVGVIVRFDYTDLAVADSQIRDQGDSYSAGALLGRKLRLPGLKAIFVLSDGTAVNGTELIQGINSEVDPSVVITGGLAADGNRFSKTWTLSNSGLASGTVCGVGFYGNRIQVRFGSQGGWDIFGPERKVTRSHKNILYELDSKPALDLYKEYLGDRAVGLPATGLLFPLSLSAKKADEKNLVRTILSMDEYSKSLTFAGDIPQGSTVQLMKANFDRLIYGALLAVHQLGNLALSGSDSILTIAVSCVGRKLILGERTEEEVEAVHSVLPNYARQIGFYSYGELSPHPNGRCDLHNQTMTLTVLYEV